VHRITVSFGIWSNESAVLVVQVLAEVRFTIRKNGSILTFRSDPNQEINSK